MHIRILPSILMFVMCSFLSAQEGTEIYLFDLQEQDGQITISNPLNISNKEGYDNQPSFTEDGTALLFSSFRDGQADISKYFIEEKIFPKAEPYGWNNYPYDYYNIWVKNAGEQPFMEEPTLEILTKEYDDYF